MDEDLYEWDEAKSQECLKRRGFDFSIIQDFDWKCVIKDNRRDYGEARFRAFGTIEGEPYSVAFTLRGERIRIISLRRMHEKEAKRYDL